MKTENKLFKTLFKFNAINITLGLKYLRASPDHGVATKLIGKKKANYQMTNGPGKLTKALGINLNQNALSYHSDTLWIEESEMDISDKDISVSTRIGIEYAEEDALLPYRFLLDYSRYI